MEFLKYNTLVAFRKLQFIKLIIHKKVSVLSMYGKRVSLRLDQLVSQFRGNFNEFLQRSRLIFL